MNKRSTFVPRSIFWCAAFLIAMLSNLTAADFSVTSPGFFYDINGQQPNPTLTLTRGVTYTFAINTDDFHPFQIVDENFAEYDNGVANNNINLGTITFTVPADAPDLLRYICSFHGFGNDINIISAAAPPAPLVKVVSVSLSPNNVTLKSNGTNGWTVVPEFSSNLTAQTWFTVPSFTNVFLNGTNTTTFNRLDPICGPNVFLRLRNTNN